MFLESCLLSLPCDFQTSQTMVQQLYSNGLKYSLPDMANMFGSQGGGGGGEGLGGDGGMAMWNHGIKGDPKEPGDTEVCLFHVCLLWAHT